MVGMSGKWQISQVHKGWSDCGVSHVMPQKPSWYVKFEFSLLNQTELFLLLFILFIQLRFPPWCAARICSVLTRSRVQQKQEVTFGEERKSNDFDQRYSLAQSDTCLVFHNKHIQETALIEKCSALWTISQIVHTGSSANGNTLLTKRQKKSSVFAVVGVFRCIWRLNLVVLLDVAALGYTQIVSLCNFRIFYLICLK